MSFAPLPHNFYDPSRSGFLFFLALLTTMFICVALPRALVFAPAVVGLIGVAVIYFKSRMLPVFDRRLAGFLAAILALAAASAFWSMDIAFALERTAKTAPLFLFGVILLGACGYITAHSARQAAIAKGAVLCCAFAGLVIFFEYKNTFPVSRFLLGLDADTKEASIKSGFILNRSLVYLVLLCMPVLLALKLGPLTRNTKIIFTGILLLCLAASFCYTKSQTAQITALVIIAMAIYPSHRKKARLFMTGVILAMLFTLPFLMKPAYEAALKIDISDMKKDFLYEASIIHRLEVWNFIGEKIKERPLLGHGIEATRFLKSDEIMPYMATDHVLHPHNVVLQIWVEFGLAGVLLAAAFLIYLMRGLEKLPPLLQRYYAALLVAVLCVLSISYGLWQGWQIGMIFALLGLSTAITRIYGIPHEEDEKPLPAS